MSENFPIRTFCVLLLAIFSIKANAKIYHVGTSKENITIQSVLSLLAPGDVVLVDGDATYSSEVTLSKSGTELAPITIKGLKINGKRPLLSGGTGKYGFNITADFYIIEGFEITGKSKAAIGHYANGIIVRDCVIHDNPRDGIIGYGSYSGSLTVEYCELYHNGENYTDKIFAAHQIYMATDELAYPDAVFRLQYCYIHDGNGGNNVKSRSGRTEIYYNWIESAGYHGLELIGFDLPDNLKANAATLREDGDVVGNVIIASAPWSCARVGGDKPDAASYGRFRFVNNTFILNGPSDAVRMHEGVNTIEFYNNVVYNNIPDENSKVFNEIEMNWLDGRQVKGSNNWIQTGTNNIPPELTETIYGTNPRFVDAAASRFKLIATSPLINKGNPSPGTISNYPFLNPLISPAYYPPTRALQVKPAQKRPSDGAIDIGAYEFGLDITAEPTNN